MSAPASDNVALLNALSAGQPVPRGLGERLAEVPPALKQILVVATQRKAGDILLVPASPPMIFVMGRWTPLTDQSLTDHDIVACVDGMLSDLQQRKLHEVRDLDFSIGIPDVGRFRLNIHYQRGTLAVAIRAIPNKVPEFSTLNLPTSVLGFADHPNGIVLVTGGTGQGKSTTLAALLNHINQTRSAHIITIEDPIEFCFEHGNCLIEQRQIGDDSPSFALALRHVLRQRPDVIMIGEMRDQETIAAALTAAETGHLVLATLHTNSAPQTLSRIIDVFSPAQQNQVRAQLAASLRAILCQTLLPDEINQTLVPATELLIATSGIRRTIRDNETHLISSMIETGRRHGMHTLEQSLKTLVDSGRVTSDAAMFAAADTLRMHKLLGLAPEPSASATQRVSVAVPEARPVNVPWSEE